MQALTNGYWSDFADTSCYDNNTEYEISTAEQLAGLAKLVNDKTDSFIGKIIRLTADIDLSDHHWVPIGLSDIFDSDRNCLNVFKGSFDGGNHIIKNVKIGTEEIHATYKYAGLFGYLEVDSGNEIKIENLVIGEGSHVYTKLGGVVYDAGIIAQASGQITISNCYNIGDIHACSDEANAYAAGILARSSGQMTISNCYNTSDVSAEHSTHLPSHTYVAGILAKSLGSITIFNCYNIGNIHANVSYNAYAAGIVAGISGQITISNCYNTGNIQAIASYVYAAGIIAQANYTKSYINDFMVYVSGSITISNCYNTGDVYAEHSTYMSQVSSLKPTLLTFQATQSSPSQKSQ